MIRVEKPGIYLMYQNELVKVIGIGNGKTILMQPVDNPICPHCGQIKQYDVLESSPLFQQNVKPVETIP